MKAIHYDTEGDILSMTFTDPGEQRHTGIELSDNIILYYNPETEQPLKLILLSYQRLLQASIQAPIILDGLAQVPENTRTTITALLQRAPLTTFIKLVETHDKKPPTSRLQEIFTPNALKMVIAG